MHGKDNHTTTVTKLFVKTTIWFCCVLRDLFREGIGKHYVDSNFSNHFGAIYYRTRSHFPIHMVIDYLGMWMSDDLKWSKHIEQITKAGWANFTGGSIPILILSH